MKRVKKRKYIYPNNQPDFHLVKDMVGKKYGRLLVLSLEGNAKQHCECLCDCGQHYTGLVNLLRTGNTRSCGCLKTDHPGTPFNKMPKDVMTVDWTLTNLELAEKYQVTRQNISRIRIKLVKKGLLKRIAGMHKAGRPNSRKTNYAKNSKI